MGARRRQDGVAEFEQLAPYLAIVIIINTVIIRPFRTFMVCMFSSNVINATQSPQFMANTILSIIVPALASLVVSREAALRWEHPTNMETEAIVLKVIEDLYVPDEAKT